MVTWSAFARIWVIDFEFTAPRGDRPTPICQVAHDVCSGTTHRFGPDALAAMTRPPFGGPDELIVGYFLTAEAGCYLALGWPLPCHVLDLFVEFRCCTNDGERRGRSLLDACATFGLSTIDAAEKESLRALAIRGGPYCPEEVRALLDYCESDVRVTAALLARMRPLLDLPRALLRGRSMVAFAHAEHTGVPIDVPRLRHLQAHWDAIKGALVADVDRHYGVYDGVTFKADRFDRYLAAHGIRWPRLESGALDLKEQTFRDQAKAFPQLHKLRELRASLADLRLGELAVGADGRNRVLLSPFGSKTGRCTPSTTASVFGPSTWIRSLIRPAPGTALVYCDWRQQEIGVAAALSRDPALLTAYASGDPYFAFAQQAQAVPAGATAATHPHVREQFKTCMLGVQYGIGAESLALRLGQAPAYGAQLLRQHRQTYPQFWRWAEATVSYATAYGRLCSRFGWPLRVTGATTPRTLQNYACQANGSELLRLACCFVTEAHLGLCMPIHDALLVECPSADLDATVRTVQRLMAEASAIVLDGFTLSTAASVVRYPDRYQDPRGAAMWRTLTRLLPALEEDCDEDAEPAGDARGAVGRPGADVVSAV